MIKYLQPWKKQPKDELTERVIRQVRAEFGAFVDPMAMHVPVPAILAAAWSALRETMLAGRVERRYKEAVAAAVSQANRCPFCVDAHSIMLHAATGSSRLARALRRGQAEPFSDSEMQRCAQWAASSARRFGRPLEEGPPFAPEQAPEFYGTLLCMHYINRVAHALLSDTPVPSSFSAFKRLTLYFSGYYFASSVNSQHAPGASLALLPENLGAAPEDLAWAEPEPRIQTAFTALVEAVEAASREPLCGQAKRRIRQRIRTWQGEDMPLGGGWIEQALEGLSSDAKPSARLALLAALASYRIDETEVDAFRQAWPEDAALVSVLAWGSLQAARRIVREMKQAGNRTTGKRAIPAVIRTKKA